VLYFQFEGGFPITSVLCYMPHLWPQAFSSARPVSLRRNMGQIKHLQLLKEERCRSLHQAGKREFSFLVKLRKLYNPCINPDGKDSSGTTNCHCTYLLSIKKSIWKEGKNVLGTSIPFSSFIMYSLIPSHPKHHKNNLTNPFIYPDTLGHSKLYHPVIHLTSSAQIHPPSSSSQPPSSHPFQFPITAYA
jgi:hypothetical protein